MGLSLKLSANDLAALLCSRVCHDIISPVGAINNAIELFDDGAAQDDAIDLIRMSAANASARLQFARMAFGASGASNSEIDLREAAIVAQKYMEHEKADLLWQLEPRLIAKNAVKLLLNLILIANASIPRGGRIQITSTGNDKQLQFILKVTGKLLRVAPKFKLLHDNVPLDEPIDAHMVQSYYTLLLADIANMPITVDEEQDFICFKAG